MDISEDATVLITRFSALGDVAMSVPVVYDICRSNPGRRFVMVTKRAVAGLFVCPPDNLTVEGVDLKEYSGPTGLVRLFRRLRRDYRYDTLVDLHDVTRTKVIRGLSRLAGVRIGVIDKRRADRRRLLRRPHDKARPELEDSFTRYRNAFAQVGLTGRGLFMSVFDSGEPDVSDLAGIIGTGKPAGERWIAIAPFAAHPGKVYPEPLMRQVMAALTARPEFRLFVFGAGEQECGSIRRMADGLPRVISMADRRVGLARELKLLRLMDAALTMDSGNMHLAAIAGTKVVSVWGQTHPCCGFSAWRQPPSRAVGADMPCRPCSVFGNRPCATADFRCLTSVAPSAIIARIDQTIGYKNDR